MTGAKPSAQQLQSRHKPTFRGEWSDWRDVDGARWLTEESQAAIQLLGGRRRIVVTVAMRGGPSAQYRLRPRK